MKLGIQILVLFFSSIAMANATTTTKIIGSCYSEIGYEISILGDTEAAVQEVLDVNGDTLVVSYIRDSEESAISGEAEVKLKVLKAKKANKSTIIEKCKVLSAKILDERAG